MAFNIVSQHAGQINNVDGDQVIHGGQHATIVSTADALAVVGQLRAAVGAERLPRSKHSTAKRHVDEIEEQLRAPEADKATIGDRLAKLAVLLTSAGAVVTSGTAIGQAIAGLATWLGGFGATALSLVTRVG